MLRRSFLSLAASKSSQIYELRMYQIVPEKYDAFNQLAMQMMPQRPSIGHCQGYWTVQMGGLNEFIQIWKYDNLQHRYDCLKTLGQDKEWIRSFEKPIGQMLMSQSNMLLRMVHREGNASPKSYKYLMQMSPHKEIELSGPSAILAATFQVVVGEREGSYIHIVKGQHLDDVIPVQPCIGCSSKIMGPVRWSTTVGSQWK